MRPEKVYNWFLQNGEFDRDLISLLQKECFNKRLDAAKVINYKELQTILQNDRRFSDPRIALNWIWIFDLEYAVIDIAVLEQILSQLKDIHNEWTVVAIVQAITGLNCGFIWSGRKVVNNNITNEDMFGHGHITLDNGNIVIKCYDRHNNEVKEGDVIIGLVIFD